MTLHTAAIQPEKKLGRGISALLGENKIKQDTAKPQINEGQELIDHVDIKKIIAGVYQPRKNFDEQEIVELAESIKENGLIQPIILRKIAEDDHYEIIAGERRYRACKVAGLNKIPAIIKKINNHEALELALIENIQRSDLSVIEEALGYQQLIDEFSYSQEQIAKRVGKSRSHITNILRLLSLPVSIHELLDKKLISMGHARSIINSNNPEKLAKRIIEESLNVRQVEDLVRDEKIEKVKNIPAFVRSESQINFISSEYLNQMSHELTEKIGMSTKISYNSFRNSGKITISFSDFNKLQDLVERLGDQKRADELSSIN
jgi:ParB family chromosome partitioning protein